MSGRIVRPLALVVLLLLLLAGLTTLAARATAPAPEMAAPGAPPEPQRERDGDAAAPEISFIESPDPTCYRPDPRTDTCFINWYYLSVDASSSAYIISMTVGIDGQLVASHQGFFQSSMYVPGVLYGDGFQVSCGVPGKAGIPGLGRTHSYVLRARETGGLKAANYGTVTCPAGLERVYVPVALH
jgi:hypothetical protein